MLRFCPLQDLDIEHLAPDLEFRNFVNGCEIPKFMQLMKGMRQLNWRFTAALHWVTEAQGRQERWMGLMCLKFSKHRHQPPNWVRYQRESEFQRLNHLLRHRVNYLVMAKCVTLTLASLGSWSWGHTGSTRWMENTHCPFFALVTIFNTYFANTFILFEDCRCAEAGWLQWNEYYVKTR